VHDHHDVAGEQVRGVRTGLGRRPALGIGQEDLDAVGVHLRRPGERAAVVELVVVGQPGADMYADRVSYRVTCHA
jgi:hypothetical protein